jgi:hypothetical protein
MAIAAGSWMSGLPRVCLWVMLWLLPANCKIHKSIRKTNVSTMLIPFKKKMPLEKKQLYRRFVIGCRMNKRPGLPLEKI